MTHRDDRQHETGTALAPIAAYVRPSVSRVMPEAPFLSQLIAERHHLAPQRARRRASTPTAIGAYVRGVHIADRRIPAGWRTSFLA